jgi:uncharacterized protein (DUF697 family)
MIKRAARRIYQSVINPPSDEELNNVLQASDVGLPVLWLVGKTGAGKSSIIQKLTGYDRVEVGNGFQPCTQASSVFDYPPQRPLLQFLDTRGLGEVGYDPQADLDVLSGRSHAVVAVVRVGDSEQRQVTEALRKIRKGAPHIGPGALLVVHTALHQVPNDGDRQRAIASNQRQLEKAWGQPLDQCAIDFTDPEDGIEPHDRGIDELKGALSSKLPALQLWLLKQRRQDAEQRNFERLKTQVLWYAGVAGISDAVPVAGLVTVPATQGKMLHSLAQQYGMVWDRRSFAEFVGILGTGFGLRYLGSLGARQLAKLVPVYGQTIGSVAAASVSFVSTYAIGRAACMFLYQRSQGKVVDEDTLKTIYQQAIQDGTMARKDITVDAGNE